MNRNITRNVLLVLLYWGFGLSTELLAIPPDFATPVWPSAGIALGFVVVYGPAVFPGVFIGALAANISASLAQGSPADIQHIGFSLVISLGAVLQAAFARHLLLRLSLLPEELASGAQILQFLLVIGPLSCLINSVNGATMLALFGIIPWGVWLSNWVVWWVGDSVGALVVTPFIVRILTWTPSSGNRFLQSASLPVVFLFLVIAAFFFVRGGELENRRTLIADIGQQFEAVLKLNINEVGVILNSATSFFVASEYVSVDEFDTFFAPLVEKHPTVFAVQWLPLIKEHERNSFVAFMRQSGFEDFEIRELDVGNNIIVSRDRAEYLPITYIYPAEGNESAHGLDVLSLDYRSDPARALSTGMPQASNPVSLLQHDKSVLSYIFVSPVKKRHKENYAGEIQVLFKVEDLLTQSMSGGGLAESLRLVDITDQNNPVIIHGGGHQKIPAEWSSSFRFLDRMIRIDLFSTYGMLKRVSYWQSYLILIGGLLYVAMLEAVLLTILTRQGAIESQVEIKTRELAQAKDVAERASRAKTEFLASMSHELRTPLNSVIGFTRRVMLRSSSNLDERSRDALVIVERNANHLLGLINNLLDISKVDLGKLELSLSEVALDSLLAEAANQFMPLANAKGTKLNLDCRFHGLIEGDETRLRQVIINLLSNAIKFTLKGEINIRLYEKTESEVRGVQLEVEDNGIGIAKDDIKKLFNKFQKVGQMEKLNPEGTGLGLALVKELVEIHQGTVSVTSEPGKLTVFSVWLPQQQAEVVSSSD